MKRSSSVLTSTVTRALIVLGEDSPIIDGGVVLDSQEANHSEPQQEQLVDQENTVSVSILSIMTAIMKLYHHLVS